MSNFETIRNKLQEFIKKYYTNELLKGTILFFAIGLLYFMVTLFVEYMLWLNPTARTILFWTFVIVELGLFIKFIAIPLAKLFNLRKGINYETASELIGSHFPEVNDKLLNVLQLNQSSAQSDLLIASIEQKSQELQPIPFKSAINFKSNTKYLKYAAIPVVILLLSYVTGKVDWFSDSYERVVNYQTAYEPPAPFQFFVLNESLKAIENKSFKLQIRTIGDIVPDNAEIQFENNRVFLEQIAPGEFQYVFSQLKAPISFRLSANGIESKTYDIELVKVPSLINFDLVLDYPYHTKKQDEVLKSTGSGTIPEGTKVTWIVNTKSTTDVRIYAADTLNFLSKSEGRFEAKKQLFKNYDYNIAASNDALQDYENLAFTLNIVKDAYPDLNLKVEKDSIDGQSLYFFGQVSDDYGISKLQLVYYQVNKEKEKLKESILVSKSNFDEFVSAFPNQLNVEEGVPYELYFEVYDNDVLNGYKSVKSRVFSYRKLTKDEEEQKHLQQQNETIKDISKTFDKLKAQDKELEEISKTQKEKEALNFNDKKKFEDFIKRQKEQEELMKNFNKKLQNNLEEFQNEEREKDEFKEDLKQRLDENEKQLEKDEKLLEELERMTEKINKEEFSQKLEELAKQNKNKQRSMKQLLELTKRFYVTKKAEKIKNQLDELSKKQEELSEKEEDNTETEQDKLNKEFEDIKKSLEDLKKESDKLKKPMGIPRDRKLEEDVTKEQQKAKENLKEENKKKDEQLKPQEASQKKEQAKKSQKKAAKKMKNMSEMMANMMSSGGGGGGDQLAEDAEMLRQILDNLVLFSFDQEKLMNRFKGIDVNHNQYGKFIIDQNTLREHFEHVDDSLFALSLRQPKLSEEVNKQITDVFFNIDKALGQLTENRIYQGVSSQQYTVTAANVLANNLSNVLDNMEMQMNPGSGQGGQNDMQLPDIIMNQEELNKKMQEGLKKSESGKPQDGKDGKEGEDKGEEQGGKQQGNQNGNSESQGEGDKEGSEGQNGKGKDSSREGERQGYGEGGNEELNGELYKLYQQQQKLRQALQDRIGKEGSKGSAGDLIKQMEEVELDLINKGFTNQTLQKMMDLQHQLLKLDNATFMQGQDTKRKSETNKKTFEGSTINKIPTARQYFNNTEILNRQALPLRQNFKKKVQDYFKKTND